MALDINGKINHTILGHSVVFNLCGLTYLFYSLYDTSEHIGGPIGGTILPHGLTSLVAGRHCLRPDNYAVSIAESIFPLRQQLDEAKLEIIQSLNRELDLSDEQVFLELLFGNRQTVKFSSVDGGIDFKCVLTAKGRFSLSVLFHPPVLPQLLEDSSLRKYLLGKSYFSGQNGIHFADMTYAQYDESSVRSMYAFIISRFGPVRL